jgi:hypothetical protein
MKTSSILLYYIWYIETLMGRCAQIIWEDSSCLLTKLQKLFGISGNWSIFTQSSHPLPTVLRHHNQTRSLWNKNQLLRRYPPMCWVCPRRLELNTYDSRGNVRRWPCRQCLVSFPLDCRWSNWHVTLILFSGMKSKSWKTALTHFSQRYKSACEIV